MSGAAAKAPEAQVSEEDAIYVWQRLPGKPKTWGRALYGGERFFHQYGKWTDGHADVLAVSRGYKTNCDPKDLGELMIAAWIAARVEGPLIAAKVIDGAVPGQPAHLGAWVYEETSDFAEIEAWARKTLLVEHTKPGQTLLERMDELRKQRSLISVQGEQPVTLVIVLNGTGKFGMLLHGTHYIFDGASNLQLQTVILKFLARHSNVAEAWKEVRAIPWGQEVANLPKTLPDSAGLGPTYTDDEQTPRLIFPELEGYGPSMNLEMQRDSIPGPEGLPTNFRRYISKEVTAAFNKGCKARGWQASHVLDAARTVAVWTIRNQDALAKGADKPEEKYIINFLHPVDWRRWFTKDIRDKPFICQGTAAFTTAAPLALVEPKEGEKIFSDAHLDRALAEVTDHLAPQYKAVANDDKIIGAMEPILEMIGTHSEDFPPREMLKPGDAFTSLGKMEARMPRDYNEQGGFTGKPVVVIDDVWNSGRLTLPQSGLHIWVARGEIILNSNYTAHFDDAYMSRFVDVVEALINRVARDHGGLEGTHKAQVWKGCLPLDDSAAPRAKL